MTEVLAVEVVESAPTFDPGDQNTWSSEQRDDWNKTGNIPTPKKQESAPVKEVKPPAESAPAKEPTDAAGAEPAKESQEYKARTEKRFNDLLDEVKTLKRQLSEKDKREVAPPAKADDYKPLDEKAYFEANPKATYEDFVRAAAKHEGQYEGKKAAEEAIKAERLHNQQEAAKREVDIKIKALEKLYPDAKDKVVKVGTELFDNPKIPSAVKALIDDSEVSVHLLYVIGGDADFVEMAENKPAAALRKIVLMEKSIQEELAKGGEKLARDDAGKFVKAEEPEPKPRAPKPPSEVGGKGSAPQDALKSAAEANDFRAFEAEENRRRFART